MTMTEAPPAPPGRLLAVRTTSTSRRVRNRLATVGVWLAVGCAVVPLAFVVASVARRGAGIMSLGFLTKDIPQRTRTPGPGMGPAIVGTLVTTGTASALAIPLGILAAVYLNEYGARNKLATVLRFLSDVMAGVPSIVMGLFIFTIWVLPLKERGLSAFAGSLALACLMLPIVIRTTEAMLKLVPPELREASYGLGARKSRTILTVVLPAALPGVVSGCLLAVARAAGETAPLLFTIGITNKRNFHLTGANTTLSAQIFNNASQPFPAAIDRAWGAALTLILIVVVLSTLGRLVAARFTLR
jgi:phosphate transport system permease protein